MFTISLDKFIPFVVYIVVMFFVIAIPVIYIQRPDHLVVSGSMPEIGLWGMALDYVKEINDGMGKGVPQKKRDMYKSEKKCRAIIESIFQRPFPSERPDFMKNPATGRNLECDMMNHDLKLCFERNGEGHYKQVEGFGDFEAQQQRDKIKAELLAKNGYILRVIPYTVHNDVVDQYLVDMIHNDPQLNIHLPRPKSENGQF